MNEPEPSGDGGGGRGLLGRSLRIAFLMLALAIAGLMIAAWLGGSPADLPFDYGGFD